MVIVEILEKTVQSLSQNHDLLVVFTVIILGITTIIVMLPAEWPRDRDVAD